MASLITPNEIMVMLLVGVYLPFLLFLSEFLRKKQVNPRITRKIVHTMAGLIVIPALFLLTRPFYAYLISLVFALISFLTSKASPFPSLRLKSIEEGHPMGTTYYALSLFFMFYFFFPHVLPIAFGVIALCFGDGFAALGGWLISSPSIKIFGTTKSISGSMSAGIMSFIGFLFFYLLTSIITPTLISLRSPPFLFILLFMLSILVIIVELVSPKGLDNITVPLIIAYVTSLLF